ncbi:MAG: hypothetical protein ACLR1R_10075 [Ruminococcus callidus]
MRVREAAECSLGWLDAGGFRHCIDGQAGRSGSGWDLKPAKRLRRGFAAVRQ